jgi:hypothetical protein
MSNRFLGPLLLISWLFFANAFLLNIVVAVICEAFVEVTEENKEATEAVMLTSSSAIITLTSSSAIITLTSSSAIITL